MNLHQLSLLFKRNFRLILSFLIISILLGLTILVTSNENQFQHSIFVSISSNSKNPQSNFSYGEGLTISDNFTETLQGWFKNPALIDRITKNSAGFDGFSAFRQEKNNLVISYTTAEKQQGALIATQIKNELDKMISSYNRQSDFNFTIALFDLFSNQIGSKLNKVLIISLLIGLVLGLLASFLLEKLRGIVSFQFQIEDLGTIHHTHYGKSHKMEDMLTQKMEKDTGHKAQIINLHKEIKKIDPLKPTLIVVYLGHSNIESLVEYTKVVKNYEILLINA